MATDSPSFLEFVRILNFQSSGNFLRSVYVGGNFLSLSMSKCLLFFPVLTFDEYSLDECKILDWKCFSSEF